MSVVYFIRRKDGVGPIKIGSSRFMDRRLGALMSWSPEPLCMIATIEGDVRTERRFHSMLAKHRLHFEWFAPAPEVLSVVAQVQRGTFDLSRLHNYSDKPRRRTPDSEERRLHDLRLVRELNRLTKAAHVANPAEVLRAKSELCATEGEAYRAAVRVIRRRISDLMAAEMIASSSEEKAA